MQGANFSMLRRSFFGTNHPMLKGCYYNTTLSCNKFYFDILQSFRLEMTNICENLAFAALKFVWHELPMLGGCLHGRGSLC